MASARRIGFVDHQLDNYHANTFLGLVRGGLKARGYEVAGCHATDHEAGRAWAAGHDVTYYETPEGLDGAVDCYMVLAPSDPQLHLPLFEKIARFGKATYVDKTFAPDLATARRIFDLADTHGVAMQTTSALRYTNVQREAEALGRSELQHMVTWGSGRSFGEYAIHPTELLVSCMGPGVVSLMRRGSGNMSQLLVNFTGGRTGVVNVYVETATPFAASLTSTKQTRLVTVDGATLFADAMAGILDFFDEGKPGIDREESLAIRRILDAAENPAALVGFVSL